MIKTPADYLKAEFNTLHLSTGSSLVDSEQKIRALVIEDNPTQANMLRISLTRRGFEVEAVAYLAHGLERLERGNIDVILLDLSLPDSDGIQTFYEIYNRVPEVPIVVLSGLNDHAVAQAALEGGAQDYLVKGVPSDESISRCLRYAIERHRFERKLWESERTTRLIVENAHDAFISMDAEGKTTGWNLKAEAIFGWYRKDTIGKPLLDLIVPADVRLFFQQQIGAFLQGHRGNLVNNRVETFLLRADGSQFPAELAMFPVTIGSIYTLCGFVQDISDRKLVEQRLQQINSELERLVHSQTAQLDDTSRQLQQFAKQTSRELQVPLVEMQSMVLALATELKDLGNPRVEERIDRILESANHLTAAIQGLANQNHAKLQSSNTGQNSFTGTNFPANSGQPGQGRAASAAGAPPISQINLPDQMVPTSNISPNNLNNGANVTKTMPSIDKLPHNANATKTLPAMERPKPPKEKN